MFYVVIILSIACAVFFVWAARDYRKRKRELDEKKDKPPFRSEEDLEEYGKPMKDEDYNPVDFDDAE